MSVEVCRRVLLYGNSIILESIRASLLQSDLLEVMGFESPPGDQRVVHELKPDIILFDSEATPAEGLLPLLEPNATVLLIGVSPDVNLVKVWSSRQIREVSLPELIEIITGEKRELD